MLFLWEREGGRVSKAYGSDMLTVSRSRSLVASTDVVFIQWLFLPRYRVQMYCSAPGITGWEKEMIGKGFITRLTIQVRLPFSAVSALVPYTLLKTIHAKTFFF